MNNSLPQNYFSPSKRTLFLLFSLGVFSLPSLPAPKALAAAPALENQGAISYWELQKEKQADVIDPDEPPPADEAIGKRQLIKFGGRISSDFNSRRNYDLDSDEADAKGTFGPNISLSMTVNPHKNVSFFGNMSFGRDFNTIDKGKNKSDNDWELNWNQANITITDVPLKGLKFVAGRQRFKDERQWYMNKTSDGFKLAFDRNKFSVESGIFWQGILDNDILNDESDPRRDNYYLRGSYRFSKKLKLSPAVLLRRDHSPDQEQLIFFGALAEGELIRNLEYWAQVGSTIGKERTDDDATDGGYTNFGGIGFDIGTRYQFDLPLKPALVLGFAFGSGNENSSSKKDTGFRQSGLEGNSDSIDGVRTVNYYGELFNPELSNLMVLTAGIASKPIKKGSIQVLYHDYIQQYASSYIRDASIDADPDGNSKRLGGELDFVLALKNIKRFDLTATFGIFMPNFAAFSEEADTIAFLAKVKTRFNF